jgi:hypothetical protein
MSYQLELYGIKNYNFYLVDRFTNIHQNYKLTGPCIEGISSHGTTISHLNSMRNWYLNTDEEYAFFGDDDFSLETVPYWSFTWDDFIQKLPEDWECVQLIRVDNELENDQTKYGNNLQLLPGRWWGVSSIMKRSYVAKVLEKTFLHYNHIHLEVGRYYPIVENILFLAGRVYNIPFVIDNTNFQSTYTTGQYKGAGDFHRYSSEYFLNLWKTKGLNMTIDEIIYGQN